jgi:flagellar FliJ protein
VKFSFGLQSLLNWKKNLEESSQMRLAEKIRQLRAQEEEIQRLIQQRLENEEKLHEKMRGGIQAGEYLIYKQFGEDSFQDLSQKEAKKQHRMREIASEREVLTGFMRERKMLEKLREKRSKTFIYQVEKLEQKDSDERVIQQYQTNSKENHL